MKKLKLIYEAIGDEAYYRIMAEYYADRHHGEENFLIHVNRHNNIEGAFAWFLTEDGHMYHSKINQKIIRCLK